ncbi:hypothetical protein TB1_011838 [Malus domestica]
MEKELRIAINKEEAYWQVKSRVQWLNEGDKNTKFFHAQTMKRRRFNQIRGLEDGNGIWHESCVDSQMTHEDNEALIASVTGIKIKEAVSKFPPLELQDLMGSLASMEELKGVVEVLKTYAAGSGQEINLSKSSISFGSKTPKKIRKTIERIFNIQSKDDFGRYLGLQADFRHSKKAVFKEDFQGGQWWEKNVLGLESASLVTCFGSPLLSNSIPFIWKVLTFLEVGRISVIGFEPLEVVEVWKQNIAKFRGARAQKGVEKSPRMGNVAIESMPRRVQWKPPLFGTLKVNSDAAWCKDMLRAGVGWVVCDFAGLLQPAGGLGELFCHSTAIAEVVAVRDSLEFCCK